MDCYRAALDIDEAHAIAYGQLGGALVETGDAESAVESFRKAASLDPSSARMHTRLIFAMELDSRFDMAAIFLERKRWWRRHGRAWARLIEPHENDPDPNRRIRVGYFSPSFRHHSASMAFERIVIGHDRRRFEVVCYSERNFLV